MSADLLARAAKAMRERAEAATGGPWQAKRLGIRQQVVVYDGPEPNRLRTWTVIAEGCAEEVDVADAYLLPADAEHIAAIGNPAVALAVADWLELVDQRHHYAESHVLAISEDGVDWTDIAIEAPDGSVISTRPPDIACSHDPRAQAPWPCPERDAAEAVARTYLGETA